MRIVAPPANPSHAPSAGYTNSFANQLEPASLRFMSGQPAPDPAIVNASDIREFMFELRRIARTLLAGERNAHSVQATDLVHSAFYRNTIRDSVWKDVTWANRQYFFADMIRAMRRSLIDRVRRYRAAKRPPLVFFDPAEMPVDFSRDLEKKPERLEMLDEALIRLEKSNPEISIIIHYHYYVGLTTGEVAEMLEVSEKTVDRGLKKARILLAEQMMKTPLI